MADGDWITEHLHPGHSQGIRTTTLLERRQTLYQLAEVYETELFGRVLVLEGAIQTTERDEAHYHELLTFPVILGHPTPRRVLVIGGGDGGAVRRAFMRRGVDEVTLCELDEDVVTLARAHLGAIHGGALDDARTTIVYRDGHEFLREAGPVFDVIIVDSPDPVGPARSLFSPEFYAQLRQALTPGGAVACQAGSPLFQPELWKQVADGLAGHFELVLPYWGVVPSYPGAAWAFVLGSDSFDPRGLDPREIDRRLTDEATPTYVSPHILSSLFALPAFLGRIVEEGLWR